MLCIERNYALSPSVPLLEVPPAIPLSITSVIGAVTLSGVCEPVDILEPSYWETLPAPALARLIAGLRADFFMLEEPPPDLTVEVDFLLREALVPPRLADDPLEAAFFGAAFFGAAFLGAVFLAAFFGAVFFTADFLGAAFFIFLGAAFLGAAFFVAAFFVAAFLTAVFLAAAFFKVVFLAAAFFIPFLAAFFEPPLEEFLEADFPLRLAVFEDFDPPRLAELLLALFDEDLLLPELLEAGFFVAAFFFAFAIF